jgi:N6-adenosine-specific RNA methylase IME4
VLGLSPDKQREIVAKSLGERKPAEAFARTVRGEENESRHHQIIASARRHDLRGRRYTILLADPPWRGRIGRGGRSPYPRLSIEEVCGFRLDDGRLVRDAMADDSILLLWCIDNIILTGGVPKILKAWGGFEFKYFLPWPMIDIGLGQYARPQHALALMCVRGNFPRPYVSTSIVGPPLIGGNGFQFAPPHDSRHSSKPPRLQENIEHAYPQYFDDRTIENPLALELFARTYRPRWDGQGYEYPGRPEHAIVRGLPPDGSQESAVASRVLATATLLKPTSDIKLPAAALAPTASAPKEDGDAERIGRCEAPTPSRGVRRPEPF